MSRGNGKVIYNRGHKTIEHFNILVYVPITVSSVTWYLVQQTRVA